MHCEPASTGKHPAKHANLGRSRPSRCLAALSASVTSFFEEADNEQENHGADYGVDDCRNDAADKDKPDQRQQPAGNDRTDDADNDVADQAEAVTLDDQTREPTSDRSDDQPK